MTSFFFLFQSRLAATFFLVYFSFFLSIPCLSLGETLGPRAATPNDRAEWHQAEKLSRVLLISIFKESA